MKKNSLCLAMAMICMWGFSGCQKAPEISDNGEIPHAVSSAEKEIQNIVEAGQAETAASGGRYEGMIGTEDNGIKIDAEIPAIPEKIYQIVLQKRNDFDEEALTVLLDSHSGNITDITQQALTDIKIQQSSQPGEDTFQTSFFGDDSYLLFADEEKQAGFSGNTTVNYTNKNLQQQCSAIYKTVQEIILQGGEEDSKSFSAADAKQILLEKLQKIGITEAYFYEMKRYESSAVTFYEMLFTPSYEGIGLAHELGQIGFGEVFPSGNAWITEEGVADLCLNNYCGTITQKTEAENILGFSKIEEIIEQYLQNNTLHGSSQFTLTQIEFVYYPILKESELHLIPTWHIYTPMNEWLDSGAESFLSNGNAWNIYINAVTGELERVE